MSVLIDTTKVPLQNLHHIPLFKMLLINLPETLTGPTISHKLTLTSIINPNSAVTGSFKVYITKNNDLYEKSTYTIPSLTAGSFSSSSLLINSRQTAFLYANYTFTFKNSKRIYAGSTIKVAFFINQFTFNYAYCKNLHSNLKSRIKNI